MKPLRLKLVTTGVRYCIRHEGIIDCDEDECDFRDDDERACVPRQLVYRTRVRGASSSAATTRTPTP